MRCFIRDDDSHLTGRPLEQGGAPLVLRKNRFSNLSNNDRMTLCPTGESRTVALDRQMADAAKKMSFTLKSADADQLPAIESLLDRAFGPGRLAKSSYRLREGVAPLDELCFVAFDDATGALCGSIQYWPVLLKFDDGSTPAPALLLGPLAIDPACQGKGVGQALMAHTLTLAAEQGHSAVILVGDEPYYAKAGFSRLGAFGLRLPGPFDPSRLLGRNLQDGALTGNAAAIVKAE